MTAPQKALIIKLLSGCYLKKSTLSTGAKSYRLYDGRGNVLLRLHARTVDSIDRFIDPKIKIWKHTPDGRITLNLWMVRRLHGKCLIKRMYKTREALQDPFNIYKPRKKTSKPQSNEKVQYLF
ncbi:MAG TPA: hypothetical protein VK644_01550 [Chitinophagaceae bacterium]|nr:hypothetical protein [Chitinophagaceae bacterium]